MQELCEVKGLVGNLKDYIEFKNNVKKGEKFIIKEDCKRIFDHLNFKHSFLDFEMPKGTVKFVKSLCVSYLKENNKVVKLYAPMITDTYHISSLNNNDYLIFNKDCKFVAVFKIDTEMGTIKEVDLELFLQAHGSKEK